MTKPFRNTKNVYHDVARAVRDQKLPSRATVAIYLGRSPATIGRVIDQLILEEVIFETGKKRNGGKGRPPQIA